MKILHWMKKENSGLARSMEQEAVRVKVMCLLHFTGVGG